MIAFVLPFGDFIRRFGGTAAAGGRQSKALNAAPLSPEHSYLPAKPLRYFSLGVFPNISNSESL